MRPVQLAVLVLLPCLLTSISCDGGLRIPRILHRNFMGGADALYAAANDPQSGFKTHWLASCKVHNPHWQEIIWDASAVRALIEQDFPWFLQTYLSYPKLVQRSDVTRYMVLYKFGGVYLDADVECYSPLEQSLWDKDLVLNCEWPESQAQIHNAAMASAPNHPFWLAVLREAMQRAPNPEKTSVSSLQQSSGRGQVATAAVAAAAAKEVCELSSSRNSSRNSSRGVMLRGWGSLRVGLRAAYGDLKRRVRASVRQLWQSSPFHDEVNVVLRSTGPMLLTSVYKTYTGGSRPMCGRSVQTAGLVNHVYELGSWFTPCFFRDTECQRLWATQHWTLTRTHSQQQQQQQKRQQQRSVVGIHHYSGSWTDWDKSSKQHWQQEVDKQASQHVWEFLLGPLFVEYNCSVPLVVQTPTPGSSSSSSGSSSSMNGPAHLCMEFISDAIRTRTCAMVSVVHDADQQPAAAAAASRTAAAAAKDHCRGSTPATCYAQSKAEAPNAAAAFEATAGTLVEHNVASAATAAAAAAAAAGSSATTTRGFADSASCPESLGDQDNTCQHFLKEESDTDLQASALEHCSTTSASGKIITNRPQTSESKKGQVRFSHTATPLSGMELSTEQVLHRLGCDVVLLSSEYDYAMLLPTSAAAVGEGRAMKANSKFCRPSSGGWKLFQGRLGVSAAAAAETVVAKPQQQQEQQQEQQEQQEGEEVEEGLFPAAAGGRLQASASVGVVSLQELLLLAASEDQQQQQAPRFNRQQQQQQEDAGNEREVGSQQRSSFSELASQDELPIRYVLRVICEACDMMRLVQALSHSKTTSGSQPSPLQHVEILLLDLKIQDSSRPEGFSNSSGGSGVGGSSSDRSNKKGKAGTSSSSSGSRNDELNCPDGLRAFYNLLYQQYGFAGFYRQQVDGGALRFGWVRQPYRMTARVGVFDSSGA